MSIKVPLPNLDIQSSNVGKYIWAPHAEWLTKRVNEMVTNVKDNKSDVCLAIDKADDAIEKKVKQERNKQNKDKFGPMVQDFVDLTKSWTGVFRNPSKNPAPLKDEFEEANKIIFDGRSEYINDMTSLELTKNQLLQQNISAIVNDRDDASNLLKRIDIDAKCKSLLKNFIEKFDNVNNFPDKLEKAKQTMKTIADCAKKLYQCLEQYKPKPGNEGSRYRLPYVVKLINFFKQEYDHYATLSNISISNANSRPGNIVVKTALTQLPQSKKRDKVKVLTDKVTRGTRRFMKSPVTF